MKDARTKELDDNLKNYNQDLENLKKYYDDGIKAAQGNTKLIEALRIARADAMKKLELKYEGQRLEIIRKYNEQAFNERIAEYDKEYELLEKQIERTRKLQDTSNLKEPAKASYQSTKTTKFLG